MKTILVLALILMMGGVAMGETLRRAETMTAEEITELYAAHQSVLEAKAKVEAIKHKIAKAHSMGKVDWMEWSTRVAFDGDFILLYYTNHMEGFIIR